MTINTFEKVLLLPKHEKITASIVWKSGAVTEKGRITNEGKSIFIYNRGSKLQVEPYCFFITLLFIL